MSQQTFLGIGLVLLSVAWQVLGVLYLGWPMGNVFLLLWFENVIITLIALGRMTVYRKTKGFSWKEFAQRSFQMPFFTALHAVFTFVLARFTGYELSMTTLYLPAALIVVRYLVEVWRQHDNPPIEFKQTYGFAWTRVAMLHLAILACWAAALPGGFGFASNPRPWVWNVRLITLLVLLTIKTLVEIRLLVRGPIGHDEPDDD